MKKLLSVLIGLLMVLATVAGALASHDNSVCEDTNVMPADVNFIAFNTAGGNIAPSSVVEGAAFTAKLTTVFNTADLAGASGETLTLEVGMYPVDSPQVLASGISTVGLSATPTRNCVSDEVFVDTIHITVPNQLDGGEIVQAVFELEAPVDSSLNNGGSRDYVLQAVLFKNCYRQCASSTGSLPIKYISQAITLVDDPAKTASQSNDGVMNGDETDIDCGGSSGNACPIGFRCESKNDCASGKVCSDIGAGHLVCTEEDAERFPVSSVVWIVGGAFVLSGVLLLWRKK